MKKSIGLYLIPKSEEYEKRAIRFLWDHMKLCERDMEKLRRYQNKLCEYRSEGTYDHLKALDLIFYAVDSQRSKMTPLMKPPIYIAWQLTRYLVRDLENNTFHCSYAELEHFWEQEMDQANKVFENWWILHKKGLTNTARGEYNLYETAFGV